MVVSETDQVDQPLEFTADFPDRLFFDSDTARRNRTVGRVQANQINVVFQLDSQDLLRVDSRSGTLYAATGLTATSRSNVTVTATKTRGSGGDSLTRVIEVMVTSGDASFEEKRVKRTVTPQSSREVDICRWTSSGGQSPAFQIISGNRRNAFALNGDKLVLQKSLADLKEDLGEGKMILKTMLH